MRKYAIPKAIYVALVLILLCLSVGYTYAYFSAIAKAESNVKLGTISALWVDNYTGSTIQSMYDNENTTETNEAMSIAISGTLQRGQPTQIEDTSSNAIKLEISNLDGTVPAYYRMKITATYDPKENGDQVSNPKPCQSTWFKLALGVGENKVFITDLNVDKHGAYGWFYNEADGYYYFGTKTTDEQTQTTTITLREVPAGEGREMADYIYLSEDADPEILGSSVNIILTLEGIQTKNNAHQTEWGI